MYINNSHRSLKKIGKYYKFIKNECRSFLLEKYIHCSPSLIKTLHSIIPEPFLKPIKGGLWFAKSCEWIKFVHTSLSNREDEISYIYELDTRYLRIKKIRNISDLESFTQKYGINNGNMIYIDWPRVAKKYDGIEVHEINRAHRITYLWYGSFDIHSGVIWNPKKLHMTLTHVVDNGIFYRVVR